MSRGLPINWLFPRLRPPSSEQQQWTSRYPTASPRAPNRGSNPRCRLYYRQLSPNPLLTVHPVYHPPFRLYPGNSQLRPRCRLPPRLIEHPVAVRLTTRLPLNPHIRHTTPLRLLRSAQSALHSPTDSPLPDRYFRSTSPNINLEQHPPSLCTLPNNNTPNTTHAFPVLYRRHSKLQPGDHLPTVVANLNTSYIDTPEHSNAYLGLHYYSSHSSLRIYHFGKQGLLHRRFRLLDPQHHLEPLAFATASAVQELYTRSVLPPVFPTGLVNGNFCS